METLIITIMSRIEGNFEHNLPIYIEGDYEKSWEIRGSYFCKNGIINIYNNYNIKVLKK